MKRITFGATVVLCVTAISIACFAYEAQRPSSPAAAEPGVKGHLGWTLPFASQAMTDNVMPQKPVGASGGPNSRAKFDHISDDTPPHQGIAPQKSQK
ncbi:MAG: hypothetical protein HY913_04000 [Desulfomonile tiedjei]|nr:hypothetical protein [Desulfomonile tiedjei]